MYCSVRPLESLLRAKDRADILQRGYVYCSCVKDNVGHHKTECRRESFPTCQPLNWGQRKCLIKGKREASDDLEIDAPEDIVAFVMTNATVSLLFFMLCNVYCFRPLVVVFPWS